MIRDWLRPHEMAALCGWSTDTLKRRAKLWREGKEWRWVQAGSRRDRQFHKGRVMQRLER